MAGRWKIEIVGHIPEDDYSPKAEIMVPSSTLGFKERRTIELLDNSVNNDELVELYEKQLKVPVYLSVNKNRISLNLSLRKPFGVLWLYRNAIVSVIAGNTTCYMEESPLRIKHFFLLKDKEYSKVKREVEAFENMERLPSERRERIPDEVRMFVWQRDKGCCIKCGSRERLEFDHIIPVAEGGSNTARNIELLCETHNRQKGKNI